MLDPSLTAKQASMRSHFDRSLCKCESGSALLAAFEERSSKLSCTDTQILFHKGEPSRCVYLVKSGEIDLILFLSPTHAIGFRAKAGSLIGLPAAFRNAPYSMTAVAYEGAQLGVMSRKKFCDMIAPSPQLSLDVLRILAAETHAARIAIIDAGKTRRVRVAAKS